jgi:phage baseplate assembly protein W
MAEIFFENETARIAIERNVVVAAWFQEPRVPLELVKAEGWTEGDLAAFVG